MLDLTVQDLMTRLCSLIQVLEEFGVPLELTVVSAHRTPERMMEYARTAPQRGLRVIIAGAGERGMVGAGQRAELCALIGAQLHALPRQISDRLRSA